MNKIQNKPNLRQFEVSKNWYNPRENCWNEEHIFTTDSFKEAVKIAYEEFKKSNSVEEWIKIVVYEADGETFVCKWNEGFILDLHKLQEYLK